MDPIFLVGFMGVVNGISFAAWKENIWAGIWMMNLVVTAGFIADVLV